MIARRRTALALMMPASILVLAFLAVPLLLLLRYSLNRFVPGQFMVEALTLDNYVKYITDPYYFAVLKTTLLMAIGVTLACLVAGFPPALFLARTTSRFKAILLLAVILPLFVGNAVRAAGWMVAFGQKGVFNYLLELVVPTWAPLTIMYTPGAVFVAIIAVNLPFVVLTLQSVLEGIDRSSEEAALSLGATPIRCLASGHLAAGDSRRARCSSAVFHPHHECLCDAGPARWSALPDDGAGSRQQRAESEQLAVWRRAVLHVDDRNLAAHCVRQRGRGASLFALSAPQGEGR
jgi:ABC-type sulfate transport system permease component